MTITITTSSSGPYIAAAQTTFAVTFQSASVSEIEVTLNNVVQSPSLYTFTRDTDGTGQVVFTLAVTGSVIIYSKPNFSQPTAFSRFGVFFPDLINTPLDRLGATDVYLKSEIARVDANILAALGGAVSSGTTPAQTIEFTATASQTVFNFLAPAAIGFVSVFINGVRLPASDFAHVGAAVTLVTGATLNDIVTLVGFTQAAVPDLTSLPLLAASNGSSLVGRNRAPGTFENKTVNNALDDSTVSFAENFTIAQMAAIAAGTPIAGISEAIQEVIDYVSIKGGLITGPVGIYDIRSPIRWKPKVSFDGRVLGGFGIPGVVFNKNFTTAGDVIYSDPADTLGAISIANLFIEGNKAGTGGATGNGINLALANGVHLRRVYAARCPQNGFIIGRGPTSTQNKLFNSYAFFNGGNGYINQADFTHFNECWADGNIIGIEVPNNAFAGSSMIVDKCHFEEFEQAAIAIRGNPAVGGTGNHKILNPKIFARPYFQAWASTGVWLDAASGPLGCINNDIVGGEYVFQTTYSTGGAPITKAGKSAILCSGGAGSLNRISVKSISNFGTGVNILAGSNSNTIDNVGFDACDLAINNAGNNTVITKTRHSTNTQDLSDTGTGLLSSDNVWSVAPTYSSSARTSNNNMGDTRSYTPALRFGGASVGMTGSFAGRYVRSGGRCSVDVTISLTAKGSSTGQGTISLPVTPAASGNLAQIWLQGTGAPAAGIFGYINAGLGVIQLWKLVASTATEADFGNDSLLFLTIEYEVA